MPEPDYLFPLSSFLDAHCQKQWASLGVKFQEKRRRRRRRRDRSWKKSLGVKFSGKKRRTRRGRSWKKSLEVKFFRKKKEEEEEGTKVEKKSIGVKFSGKRRRRRRDRSWNKNTKCPIGAHCHRHCRRDRRITKDCKKFCKFWPSEFSLALARNIQKAEKLLAKVEENSEARIEESTFSAWFESKHLQNFQCNPF